MFGTITPTTGHRTTAESIQAAHIANINRLAKAGKLIMAGPMGTDGELRGIFVMDARDSTEVAKLVDTDRLSLPDG